MFVIIHQLWLLSTSIIKATSFCVITGHLHKLKYEWTSCNYSCSSWEKISSNQSFQYGTFSSTLYKRKKVFLETIKVPVFKKKVMLTFNAFPTHLFQYGNVCALTTNNSYLTSYHYNLWQLDSFWSDGVKNIL